MIGQASALVSYSAGEWAVVVAGSLGLLVVLVWAMATLAELIDRLLRGCR